MSTRKVSKLIIPTVAAIVEEWNALVTALGLSGALLHFEETAVPVSEAAATDLTTAQALLNAIRTDYIAHIASTKKHLAADATNTVAAPASTDQATVNTLANELQLDLNAHAIIGTAVHRSAAGADARYNALVNALGQTGLLLHLQEALDGEPVVTADATDLTTAIALANEIKTDYTAHIASTAKHPAADGTNTVAAADATDQSTLETLVDELKVDVNAHQILAASHRGVGGQGAQAAPTTISTANATDLATALTLVNAERDAYNFHVRSGATIDPAGVGAAAATDLATSLVLANALKAAYNAHAVSGGQNLNVTGT